MKCRFTDEQIIGVLKEHAAVLSTKELLWTGRARRHLRAMH